MARTETIDTRLSSTQELGSMTFGGFVAVPSACLGLGLGFELANKLVNYLDNAYQIGDGIQMGVVMASTATGVIGTAGIGALVAGGLAAGACKLYNYTTR
ncbi:hypothetical protein GOV10_06950 [Candidatus Woesearchaeota archaeon]|nr:hypothetical protein [Candidatus Woesearchaeota archaeon]